MTTIPSDGAPVLPYTGTEFLDSLDDGRGVWIYGERVKNIAEHPFGTRRAWLPGCTMRCIATGTRKGGF